MAGMTSRPSVRKRLTIALIIGVVAGTFTFVLQSRVTAKASRQDVTATVSADDQTAGNGAVGSAKKTDGSG